MLITKSPTLGTTSANHMARAMMSLLPVKRVVAVLETTAPLALFPSVSDRFMHLSLLQERRKTQRLQDRFLSSSAMPKYPVYQSPRYSRRGALQLMAALSVADGLGYGQCHARKRFVDFRCLVGTVRTG